MNDAKCKHTLQGNGNTLHEHQWFVCNHFSGDCVLTAVSFLATQTILLRPAASPPSLLTYLDQ